MDSPVQGAGVGHQSFPFVLTGSKGDQGSNSGGPSAVAWSISLDQHVARAIGSTPIPSLVLGAVEYSSKDNELSISYNGPALGDVPRRPDANVGEVDPHRVFNRLFSGGLARTPGPARGPGKGRRSCSSSRGSHRPA